MNGEIPELPRLLRAVKRLASQRQGYGIEYDDLVGEGSLAIVLAMATYDPTTSPWHYYATREARRGMWNAIRRERRRPHPSSLDDEPLAGDETESLPLLGELRDREAEVVILMAGLDGGPPRSSGEVGHILGIHHANVCRVYRTAIAKLRAAIEARVGGPVELLEPCA